MSAWTQHFLNAMCQGCDWHRRDDSTDPRKGAAVLAAARRHSKATGHYVQVERGQMAHYNLPLGAGEGDNA